MKKNSPKKYEESLKNCILLARIEFFTISADPEDEYQCQLAEKIFQIQRKIENKQKDNGLFGGRYGVKWYQQLFTKFAANLGISKMCPIYRLPGFYAFDNANPCRVYQKWCAAFDGLLKESDIDLIVSAALKNDDNFYEYGVKAWKTCRNKNAGTFWASLFQSGGFGKRKLREKISPFLTDLIFTRIKPSRK